MTTEELITDLLAHDVTDTKIKLAERLRAAEGCIAVYTEDMASAYWDVYETPRVVLPWQQK